MSAEALEALAATMRRVEYDMVHRRYGIAGGFVGERDDVARIITALRAALARQDTPASDVAAEGGGA